MMQMQFIMPGEINDYLRRGAQFIDLREPEEYREKHIRGALSIPYEELESRYAGLPKNKKYVLYCERGATSMLASRKMMAAGYDVCSLSGGMAAAKRQV